jgi:outer membrane protein insertion porin family
VIVSNGEWPAEAALKVRPATIRALTCVLSLLLGAAISVPAQDAVTSPSSGTPASSTGPAILPGQNASPAPATPSAFSNPAPGTATEASAAEESESGEGSTLWSYRGVLVDAVQFDGVSFDPTDPIRALFAVHEGKPLDPIQVRAMIRRLYATGLYRSIDVRAVRHGSGTGQTVTLIFGGSARYFVGRVTIRGVKTERMSSLLEYSTQLQPGTAFTAAMVATGEQGIRQTLSTNGYYEPVIKSTTKTDEIGKQVDVTYTITVGPQARVGGVALTGPDIGMTPEEFRKRGKLKYKSKVTRETTSNALTKLRSRYQKQDHLEATVALEKQEYVAPRKQLDYTFGVNQGPTVKVTINGTKISNARRKKLLPIYEESAVDNDLLNEGAHNIREFLQRQGYFDAEVNPRVDGVGTSTQTVVFDVNEGKKYRVVAVDISGNKYFDTDTMRERMQVVKADAYVRNGRYSQTLLENDVASIQSIYRANGFSRVKVTTETLQAGTKGKLALMRVNVKIDEGQQQKFGSAKLSGVDPSREKEVRGMMNTVEDQPFSLSTVSGDRDSILQYYLAKGFEQAKVEVKQSLRADDPTQTDLTFLITEGDEVFVDKILLSGVNHTRRSVVNRPLLLKPGDPLDQSALVEMQRKYYDLALFNEANVAVQNPEGTADRKNVLVQLTEARRWDVTYGAGFEAQTGTPQTNCRAQASIGGTTCTPEGKAGASFRVSADVTRINLRGTDNSLQLHTTYGLLERVASITLNTPHLLNHQNFTGSLTGGYSNVQNISTFKASTLQAIARVTQKIPRADTLIYDFTYRRVSVDQDSLQVTANLIPLLSQPVRVGGPGVTWYHDTRSPSPLDAQKGMYLSVQDFFANSKFGSQTNFNRTDIAYSTYYTWGKRRKYTFARNTRFGFEVTSGANPNAGTTACAGILLTTNASCNPVPLPERLYAGGASSHRGFAVNSAGPRDLTTGYPVGGSAVFINTFELRLPPPVLPVVGDSVSFVLFHDMGNAFLHVHDIWPSFGRFSQPNRSTCFEVTGPSQTGTCDFAYFSHAVGLGARYGTPVGPIRVDFSYNLNPPVYPIIDDYSLPQANHAVGHGSHFQFFFSIGQSF